MKIYYKLNKTFRKISGHNLRKIMNTKFTRRQWVLIIIFNFGFIFAGICASNQAPFYPREAESKGVPSSQYGFVFGVYYLSGFISSLLCGKLIYDIGPEIICHIGLFIAGVTSILFGVIDKINGADLFFAFSLIIRIMEAFGTTAFRISAYTIFANEFPDNRATAFATLQSTLGMGVIIGPTFGGAIYEWKGYIAPFLLTGILLLSTAALTIIFLRKTDADNCKRSHKGVLLLLKQPEIWLGKAATFGAYMNAAFYQSTFETHLRPFNLSPVELGALYMINGMIFGLASPAFGIICDKYLPPQFVWCIGTILISVSLLLFGPAPYFSFQLTLPLCIFALIIHGLGQSAEIISSLPCLSKVALKIGFPDDVNTYGLTSALYAAASGLGGFIAPSFGGFLIEKIGFPWTTHILICFHISLLIITLLYNFLYSKNNFPQYTNKILPSDETKLILENIKTPKYTKNNSSKD